MPNNWLNSVTFSNVTVTSLTAADFVQGFSPNGESGGQNIVGTEGNDILNGTAQGRHHRPRSAGPTSSAARRGTTRSWVAAGNDLLDGGDGNDTIDGGDGQDTLSGGDGNDTILSGRFEDKLIDAGAGDDHVRLDYIGIPATITVTTGGGRDTIEFGTIDGSGNRVITDFAPGANGDVLDFGTLLAYAQSVGSWTGGNPFDPQAGVLRLVAQGADTVVQLDVSGAGGGATWQSMLTLQGVAPGALTASNIAGGHVPVVTGIIDGTAADDYLIGTLGADHLRGLAGNDSLSGRSGDDTLDGGNGDDFLVGSDGVDTAVFDGNRADYQVIRGAATGSPWSTSVPAVQAWSDQVMGVESFQFADGVFSLAQLTPNTAPSDITLSATLIGEQPASMTFVGLAAGVDPDAGETLTYSLDDNAGGVFTIIQETGALFVADGSTLVLPGAPTRDVVIRVTDAAGASFVKTFTITITPQAPVGTEAADTLVGSAANDSIAGLGGDDLIQGNGGSDSLIGGEGADQLDGGDGNDLLIDGVDRFTPETVAAADTLVGGAGSDSLFTLAGNDVLIGGDGNDGLDASASAGAVLLQGGDGDDYLQAGTGADTLEGGAGNDTLQKPFSTYSIVLDGGSGNDNLAASQGRRRVSSTR